CEFYPSTGYCENGATWDGKKCVCPQGFFGYQCESLLYVIPIEIPEKINATVEVLVKVTNRNFTGDLENTSSTEFQNFKKLFKDRMDKVYEELLAYRGVNVRKLLNGSIVVRHDVILQINYTLDFQDVLKDLIKTVKAKIVNETTKLQDPNKCQETSVLCYSEVDTDVNETPKLSFDPKEQCMRKAPKDFAQFYYVDELDNRLVCVTNCTAGTKTQLDCHQGTCQLQRSGPRCLCPTSNTHWHWGETCEWSTSKSLVYGSVGAVVAVLVVTVVVLAIFLGRYQKRLKRAVTLSPAIPECGGSESAELFSSVSLPPADRPHGISISRQEYNVSHDWQEEDVSGSFQNTGFWEDKNLKDRFGLDTTYSHFRPSLDNVDCTAELHMQKPKVVTSAQ
ncbi:mucin-12-like, partial [Orycteropus afer afer]|uniref:Mucin-12-like n=1 Tax=Orycteropus afer afer TaxID=1230840 RepID=A0A8B6ZXP1_ORYAF